MGEGTSEYKVKKRAVHEGGGGGGGLWKWVASSEPGTAVMRGGRPREARRSLWRAWERPMQVLHEHLIGGLPLLWSPPPRPRLALSTASLTPASGLSAAPPPPLPPPRCCCCCCCWKALGAAIPAGPEAASALLLVAPACCCCRRRRRSRSSCSWASRSAAAGRRSKQPSTG